LDVVEKRRVLTDEVKVPVLFLTEYNAMKAYWGNGDIAPPILDLSTRWR
jgi:hypothetical protein